VGPAFPAEGPTFNAASLPGSAAANSWCARTLRLGWDISGDPRMNHGRIPWLNHAIKIGIKNMKAEDLQDAFEFTRIGQVRWAPGLLSMPRMWWKDIAARSMARQPLVHLPCQCLDDAVFVVVLPSLWVEAYIIPVILWLRFYPHVPLALLTRFRMFEWYVLFPTVFFSIDNCFYQG